MLPTTFARNELAKVMVQSLYPDAVLASKVSLPYADQQTNSAPYPVLIAAAVYAIFLLLVSTWGNLFAVILYSKNRPRGNVITKHLKNVAITNLTVSATTYWMIIYNAFQAEWKFGSFGCTVFGSVQGLGAMISLFSLTAISVVDLMAAKHIQLSEDHLFSQSLDISHVVSLTFCTLVIVLPTVFKLFNYANFGCDTSCIFDYEKVSSADLKSQISIYTSTGVTILIPCLLLIAILVVTCVTKLSSYQMKKSISDEVFVDDTLDTTAEKLNGHKYELSNGTQFGTDREKAKDQGSSKTATIRVIVDGRDQKSQEITTGTEQLLRNGQSKKDADKLLLEREHFEQFSTHLLMTICFLLCWFPYSIAAILSHFEIDVMDSPVLELAVVLLAKSHTVVNPLIHFFNDKGYRKVLRQVMKSTVLQNCYLAPDVEAYRKGSVFVNK